MAEYNIGKVIPQFKGRYTTKEIYEELDVVAHNGCTWVSQSNNNTEQPSEETTKWKLVMQSPISQNDISNIDLYFKMIGGRLDEMDNKIEENKKDIFEMTTLTRDSINGSAIARSKIQEVTQRLSKIEKKLGI